MSQLDHNFLSPIEFRFTINRLPHTTFAGQRASLPGINVNPVRQNTPFKPVYHTPDSVEFGQLSFDFLVDDDLANYIEVMNWMTGISFPDEFDQYAEIVEGAKPTSDATFVIMTGQGNPGKEITYHNIFPVSLGDIPMDTTQSDVQYISCSASFQIDGFTIK